jgi:hypothetical protein
MLMKKGRHVTLQEDELISLKRKREDIQGLFSTES